MEEEKREHHMAHDPNGHRDEVSLPIVDRYGFIAEPRSTPSSGQLMLHHPDAAQKQHAEEERRKRLKVLKENARLEKWRHMIADWNRFRSRNFELVKRRIRKGVPDCLRGLMWQVFANSRDTVLRRPGLYAEILARDNAPCEGDILRDISRTFPKHILFRERHGMGQRSLLNVLKVYSVYDPAVGYCQGMGFITGLLLIYMSEEDTFWMLVSLMKNYEMEGLFKPGLPQLTKYFYQFQKLIQHFYPKLLTHLDQENVHPSMYASQWFITVFTYNFPFDVVVRVWDIFLAEGVKIVFRLALAILKLKQEELLKMPFEKILVHFKSVPNDLDPDLLIVTALRIKLTTKKLKELEDEYNAEHPEFGPQI